MIKENSVAFKMDRKVQLDELDALQSIFYNEEFQIIEKDYQKDIEVIIWAHPLLMKDYTVKYKENLETEDYSYVNINYLPPIELYLKLPEDYPSKCSPTFTLSCQWLTKKDLSKLCLQLDKIWYDNENMEIIYIWADFLKNEALKLLGFEVELDLTLLHSYHLKYRKHIEPKLKDKNKSFEQGIVNKENEIFPSEAQDSEATSTGISMEQCKERIAGFDNHTNSAKGFTSRSSGCYNVKSECGKQDVDLKVHPHYDRRARVRINLKTSPVKLLISYNSERENIEFQKQTFLCKICFTDEIGRNCTKFENCNHVFCKNCVKSYFTVQINDGTHPIKCPESKCSSDANVLQVKDLVSKELFGKYDSLLLQSALDSLDHVIYCPRTMCQYPATRDDEENLAICPYCQYVFCIFCRMVYHGVEPCKLNSEEKKKLVEKYLNSSKEVREQMELRYGRKHIQSLVNTTMAETWIDSNCKNCPKCDVSIEKSGGCNKMVCWKCSTFFCWLCSAELDRANPYSHFTDSNSRCTNKLFYLTPLGEEELEDYNSDDEQWRDWDWI